MAVCDKWFCLSVLPFGDDRNAVRHYLDACAEDRNYVFRGSLDPEIGRLLNKYDLKLYD